MPYELKLDKYSGPLDKLLELIEERKMEVTEISIAQVTDDFLKYLGSLKETAKLEGPEGMRLIADFIVVASKLIFIKSKSLLPELTLSEEEEAEIKDLEERLRLYQQLKPAMKVISTVWKEENVEISRPYFLNITGWLDGGPSVFYPGKDISLGVLQGSLDKLFDTLKAFTYENEVLREKVMTLEEKISQVSKIIADLEKASFQKISETQSKAERIITFLAILHLAREQRISLEQEEEFSDIIITTKNP